ncbi:MAG: hypothetical protein PHE20_02780 [Patescibacteria group bacterium]|nr:hypothetical protein [Patescibacteria group bacterium]
MKKLDYILRFIFWGSPLLFWLGWQLILSYPHALWILASASTLILIFVAYEFAGRKWRWRFFFTFISLALLLNSFYLFASLIAMQWIVQLLWLLMIWYLYSYISTAVKMKKNVDMTAWGLMSLYGGLYTTFFAAATLFGFQAFLSLSQWPLLLIFLVIVFANTRALAYAQSWNDKEYLGFWFFLALLTTEIVMMLSLLPLNYLIAAILSALAYYSVINFARLYINGKLSKRKITNYAWFTALSLALILLTARWL